MMLAIFCFTLMDASVKALAPRTGVMTALWARYTGQMLAVTLLVLPRLTQVVRTQYPVQQVTRSLMLMGATAMFFTGLSLIPLSDATALMALNPVLITLGAALFLRETLGPRRVVGIVIALVGALIVIRPGSDVFAPAAFLPLAAAVCYSGYVLLTRKLGPSEDPWTSLFYTGLVGTVVFSAIVPFFWQTPDLIGWLLIGAIAMFGTTGQMFLIRSVSMGEAAMLAPYAYCGLIFAALWGFVFFSEVPDSWTIIGALVIVSAGLYVWYRETFSQR
jgi:drug/metabolite transporter (DMT)-like permease